MRNKPNFEIQLKPDWTEQIEAYQEAVKIIRENIQAKNWTLATENLSVLIHGTHEYLKADFESYENRWEERHETFVTQLLNLHASNFEIDAIHLQNAESLKQALRTFNLLEDIATNSTIVRFCHQIQKNISSYFRLPSLANPAGELLTHMAIALNSINEHNLGLTLLNSALQLYQSHRLVSEEVALTTLAITTYYELKNDFKTAWQFYQQFAERIEKSLRAKLTDQLTLKPSTLREICFYGFGFAISEGDERKVELFWKIFPEINDSTPQAKILRTFRLYLDYYESNFSLIRPEKDKHFEECADELFRQSQSIFRSLGKVTSLPPHIAAHQFFNYLGNRFQSWRAKKHVIIYQTSNENLANTCHFNVDQDTLASISVAVENKRGELVIPFLGSFIRIDHRFAWILPINPRSRITLQYGKWNPYTFTEKISSGITVRNAEKIVQEMNERTGGVEFLNISWSPQQTLAEIIQQIGNLDVSHFSFSEEKDFRLFCYDFAKTFHQIQRPNSERELNRLSRETFFSGPALKIVILQRIAQNKDRPRRNGKRIASVEEVEIAVTNIIVQQQRGQT